MLALSLALLAPTYANTLPETAEPSFAMDATETRMKRPLLAAGLNWVIPGAGYLYNGAKPLYVSLPMMAGAGGLTYVENFHQFENGTLREQDPMAFGVMFGSVIILNTGLAIDAYKEAKGINAGDIERRRQARMDWSVAPAAFANAEDTTYGLNLSARF